MPAGPPPISTGAGWVAKVVPGAYAVYKYVDKNGEETPVTAVLVKWKAEKYFAIKVKADAKGNNGSIDVLPGAPTTDLGIRLTLGGGDTYCVLFGGVAGGEIADAADGSLVKAKSPTGEGCPVAP